MFWANLWWIPQDAAFLFLAYLLIEYIETRHGERIEALLAGGRALGRDSGRGAGLCAAVRLFGHCVQLLLLRVITLGT